MPTQEPQSATSKKPDRLHTSVNLLIAGVFVTLAILLAGNLWWRHQESLRAGEARAANLALILSEHLARTLNGFETTLAQLAQHSQGVGGPRAPREAWTLLKAMQDSLPGAGSISVIDETGTITQSTVDQLVGQSRRGLYLFQQISAETTDRIVVDKPFPSVIDQRPLIPIGRRLTTADGKFAGAVVVTFEPERLRGFYKSVDLGPNGLLWVLHPTGLVLFREPSGTDPMGERAPADLTRAVESDEPIRGFLRAPLGASREDYLTAYRQSADPPLAVAVSLAEKDVLAAWRNEAVAGAAVIIVVGFLLLGAGFLIGHEIRARSAAETRVMAQADALATAVAQRDDANVSLRANQARFQAVMDHTPMMVTLKDLEGRYTFANRAFQDYLGREADQILGKTALDIRPRAFAEETMAHDKAVIESKRASQREIVDPDGGRSSLVVKFPVIEDNGEVSALGTIMVDISELKRVQSALAHAQKMEALGQLTGGIAHDFNNLLTAILLNSDVLASRVENESLRTLAVAMRGAADRGADLTRRLLAFGRQQALEPKPTDVNDLLFRMEPLMHRTLGEHIDIRFVRADDLWPAQVDPGQLENAVLNLAVNARDAMPERGRLTIETGNVELDETSTRLEAKPGDYVMVAVGDTGSGMPPEVLAHVFEPFFTTKEVGRGTGLGLSMVYGFVKQSEGHIQVYSEVGVGTVVKLYLPRAHAAEVALEPAANAPTELPSGREVILLVEDDALVRAHTEHQLIALGYHVIAAEHAGEAMALLRDGLHPDLLFTDMVMPGGMNGRELGEEARKLLPGLKVLYTTGYAGAQSVSLATDALPSAYLLGKPYRRRDLATKVRAVLDERAAS